MPSTESDFLQPRLDAPDRNVRMIQLKRAQGQPLNRRDLGRLATRMSVEESTLASPQGGQVKSMLPREQDPGAAYQKGYEGTRRLFQGAEGAAPTPVARTPVQPSYVRPPSFSGANKEASADAILRKRFGAPPNERPKAPAAPEPDLGAPPVTPTTALPATPTTSAAPQTESNNPLTGDTNRAPGGTTTSVDPARAAGFSQRGAAVPAGSDQVTGGTGIFARKFSTPGAAGIYDKFVKRLFGNEPEIA
jgi:hypothetical protein